MVPREGLEPSRPCGAADFKSAVSANSTIPAPLIFVNAANILRYSHKMKLQDSDISISKMN